MSSIRGSTKMVPTAAAKGQTGATHYHQQLGLLNIDHAIKLLVVCNCWDLEPFDLLNGCYQSSAGMNRIV